MSSRSQLSLSESRNNRPLSARSRSAWGDDADDLGIDNAGMSVRSESRIMDDDIMPAAIENDMYNQSQTTSSQAVMVHEPKKSGCWSKFQSGIRGKS